MPPSRPFRQVPHTFTHQLPSLADRSEMPVHWGHPLAQMGAGCVDVTTQIVELS